MSRERLRRESGSALMLMPAGVLIVLLLGALAVDSAIMFLGERELADLTAAAANDAATLSLREDVFYRCGRLELDPAEAERTARTVAVARTSDAVELTGIGVRIDNELSPPEAIVAASGTVKLIFTPALPGNSSTRAVQATSIAAPEPLGPGAQSNGTC